MDGYYIYTLVGRCFFSRVVPAWQAQVVRQTDTKNVIAHRNTTKLRKCELFCCM